MRHAIGRAGKPLPGCFDATHDRLAGKLLDEGEEQGIQRGGGNAGGEKVEGAVDDIGVQFFAVAGDENVTGLVNEAHGKELGGMNRELGVILSVAHLVDAEGELATGHYVGEDDIAGEGKERIRELIAFTRISGNMEFHHKKACSKKLVQHAKRQCRKCCDTAAPFGFSLRSRGLNAAKSTLSPLRQWTQKSLHLMRLEYVSRGEAARWRTPHPILWRASDTG